MPQEQDRKEIDDVFADDYAQWLSIPENARGVEMRRLEEFASRYNDFDKRWSSNPKKKGEVKRSIKKLRSSLIHLSNPQWKSLADRLFPCSSPDIYLGNGFWYKKEVDFYGSTENVLHQSNRRANRISVAENVITDDGMLFVGTVSSKGNFSFLSGRGKGLSSNWAHRTDVPLEEVVQVCAQKYLDFHNSLPWNLKWLRKDFGLAEIPYATVSFTQKRGGDNRVIKVNLPDMKHNHIQPIIGESLASIVFEGSNVKLCLGSGQGFYGAEHSYNEYEEPKVSFFSMPPFSEHPLVNEFVADVLSDVGVFAGKDRQAYRPSFERLASVSEGRLLYA